MDENETKKLLDEADQPWSEPFTNNKDDNKVNEKIWEDTFELLSKYGHKWSEVHALNHIWFYMSYGFEYGTDYEKSKNIKKMYNAAPMFFSMSRIAIERTSRIELVKLFEGEENASIRHLRKYLDTNAEQICYSHYNIVRLKLLNEKLRKYLEKHLGSIGALKEIRNKHLAHNDIEFFIELGKLYEDQKVIIQDVFEIIDYLGNYLDNVAQLIQPSNASANVCPKYNELMDIQSLEMYFKDNSKRINNSPTN